ncbi:PLG [Mytilus edulis]|uniref:PLG n=1 Tax=Mytilus edulis TaxID=6550 RepID=A0A8S3PP42_MYTED|nr:PLG [Mytilus edulis]
MKNLITEGYSPRVWSQDKPILIGCSSDMMSWAAKYAESERRTETKLSELPPLSEHPRFLLQTIKMYTGECSNGGFRCIGGKCIDDALFCNGNTDCPGQDDETEAICGVCEEDAIACYDAKCIPLSSLCNGVYDCTTGEDEGGCTEPEPCLEFTCMDTSCIEYSQVCDGQLDCPWQDDEAICDDCYYRIDGKAFYNGTRSITASGITCQRWDSNFPHIPNYWPSGRGNKNYCRNPDENDRPWCYTSDPETRWEYCGIDLCDDCYYRIDGKAIYNGTRSITASGITCQRWDSNFPHIPNYWPSGRGNKNYCRNPDETDRPWCYTSDPETRWEYCGIDLCGECSNGEFRCIGGKCIDDALFCNGNPDCPAQDDETEAKCALTTQPVTTTVASTTTTTQPTTTTLSTTTLSTTEATTTTLSTTVAATTQSTTEQRTTTQMATTQTTMNLKGTEPEACLEFTCMDKSCIDYSQVCDGQLDCPWQDDEAICGTGACPPGQLTCLLDGACVHASKICDEIADCKAGEDEYNCISGDGCDEYPGHFACDGACYSSFIKCDGRVNCGTGEDEDGCTGCNANFQCHEGSCISFLKECNGVIDCPNGEDEGSQCLCSGFRCIGGTCIDDALRCDGNPDCPAQDDENEAACGMITIFVVVIETIMFLDLHT